MSLSFQLKLNEFLFKFLFSDLITNSQVKTKSAEIIKSNVLKGIDLSSINIEKTINAIKFETKLFVLKNSKAIFLIKTKVENT